MFGPLSGCSVRFSKDAPLHSVTQAGTLSVSSSTHYTRLYRSDFAEGAKAGEKDEAREP